MRNQASKIAASLVVLFAAMTIGQADPDGLDQSKIKPLSRKLAAHLIADFYEIGESEVTMAYILIGKLKKDGFETDIGAEATFIRPIVADGLRRRRVHSIRFQHDKELGWFLRAIIQEDGRSYIDVCSETKGRIRIE